MPNDKPQSLETTQHGGTHYKGFVVEPAYFNHVNGIGFAAAEAIKYLARYPRKYPDREGQITDLKKALHYVMMCLDFDYGVHARVDFDGEESSKTGETADSDLQQDQFDQVIGRLDRVLSLCVGYGRRAGELDEPNRQTLKHHAEDMIAAGQKILKDMGKDQEGLPQPLAPAPLDRTSEFRLSCGPFFATFGIPYDLEAVNLVQQIHGAESTSEFFGLACRRLRDALPETAASLLSRLLQAEFTADDAVREMFGENRHGQKVFDGESAKHSGSNPLVFDAESVEDEILKVIPKLIPQGQRSADSLQNVLRSTVRSPVVPGSVRIVTEQSGTMIVDDGQGHLVGDVSSDGANTVSYCDGRLNFRLGRQVAPGEGVLISYEFSAAPAAVDPEERKVGG